jgi:hypothetical protein
MTLKKCPFCNGEALSHKIQKHPGNEKMWRIVCMKCFAGTTMGFDEAQVTNWWNKRYENRN